MAENDPVCDILCKGLNDLSELGYNLRVRTENFKDQEIWNCVKSSHDVQKEANKILQVCGLSRKNLVNIENGLKNFILQIDASQGLSRGIDSAFEYHNVPHEYSENIKIPVNISLKHFTSVKVLIELLPNEDLNKYLSYYNPKCYDIQKEKKNQLFQDCENDVTKKLNRSNVINEKPYENPKNDSFKSSDCSKSVDSNIKEQNPSDYSLNEYSREVLESTEIQPEAINGVQDVIQKELSDGNFLENKEKRGGKECNVNLSGIKASSNITKEKNSEEFSGIKGLNKRVNLDSMLPKKYKRIKVFANDSDNEEEIIKSLSKATEQKKTYLKCVDITKLLKPDMKHMSSNENDTCSQYETKESERVDKQSIEKKDRSEDLQNINRKIKKSINKDHDKDLSRSYCQQMRNKVQSFEAKEFSINIEKLKAINDNLLHTYNLNRIIHNGSVLCNLKQQTCSIKEYIPSALNTIVSEHPNTVPDHLTMMSEHESVSNLKENSNKTDTRSHDKQETCYKVNNFPVHNNIELDEPNNVIAPLHDDRLEDTNMASLCYEVWWVMNSGEENISSSDLSDTSTIQFF